MREQNIEVTVVSGQPQPLKVNVHQTVEHLVHEALQKSGNQGQAPSEWELRTEDGRLLEQSGTVAAAAIHDGMTLGPFIATRSSCTRCCVTSRPSGSRAHARLLGIDKQGREILTFIEGEVYVSPEEEDRPAEILSDAKVVSAARLIRRFHDATAGTPLAGEAEVVCHPDLGQHNIVFQGEEAVAIIDWDEDVQPGPRLLDFAHAVWCLAELGEQGGDLAEQARRVRLLCDAYGWEDANEVINEIEARFRAPAPGTRSGLRRGRPHLRRDDRLDDEERSGDPCRALNALSAKGTRRCRA